MDKKSKVSEKLWKSILRRGWLTINNDNTKVSVTWDPKESDSILQYGLSLNGKGMELSELVKFNGKLYTCDDSTGMVYELTNDLKEVLPFVHLNDGDGSSNAAFKCEWMTVKDNSLWVGSTGKAFTDDNGNVLHNRQEWIKVVSSNGVVSNRNWGDKFLLLKKEAGYNQPGYMIHESAVFNENDSKWYFMPRKASKEAYDGKKDETKGTNLLLISDWNNVQEKKIGTLNTLRGISSFKFVPNTDNKVIVALKTVEVGDVIETYIMSYKVTGEALLDETLISNEKFEGIEFI